MREWELTPEAFDRLLHWLDPDRQQAGEKYERIRSKLIMFFEWKGVRDPQTPADETFNRVARKLLEGEMIRTPDPYKYCCGVAHRVAYETWRRAKEDPLDENRAWVSAAPTPEADAEDREAARAACLNECLGRLSSDSQALILEYYQTEGGRHMAQRQALAERRRLHANALRVRAFRLRARLEDCVAECLRAGEGPRARGQGRRTKGEEGAANHG